jgi:CheY-like chemotaxis protein
MLKKDGARPVECQDGAEAVRVVGLEPIDAVLMDISMPGMNGLEATRHIRRLHDGIQMNSAQGRRLPIIGISAHALAEDQQLCLEAGMTALVCKPIDWPLLRRTLQDVLA